jgi:hypothetical protein
MFIMTSPLCSPRQPISEPLSPTLQGDRPLTLREALLLTLKQATMFSLSRPRNGTFKVVTEVFLLEKENWCLAGQG